MFLVYLVGLIGALQMFFDDDDDDDDDDVHGLCCKKTYVFQFPL